MTAGLETVAHYGFSVPTHGVATKASEAVEIARSMGTPVALKIVSPDIIHKSDVGGVELDLFGDEPSKAATRASIGAVTRARHRPLSRASAWSRCSPEGPR